VTPDDVINYWIDEVGPKGWYAGGADLDVQVRDRFADLWQEAREGALGLWLTWPKGTLAYLIVTDQFPRNMWRGEGAAFATDKNARAAAKQAIERDWDMRIPEPERQFFYMPMMHSENLIDQDRCVRLMATRLKDTGADNLRHARAHRHIIRLFGRFPYRNDALGRLPSAAETAWIRDEGYGAALAAVDAAD